MALRHTLRSIAAHPSPLGNRIGALGRLARSHLYRRMLRRPFISPWNGLRIKVYPNSTSLFRAYVLGLHDYWEMLFLQRFLRGGDSVMDIGANVGVYALLLGKSVGPDGEVHAFEPDADNGRLLRENLALNRMDWPRVHDVAVGSRCGEVMVEVGRGNLTRVASGLRAGSARETRPVKLVSLDSVEVGRPPVYCKVDVEGYEDEVIQGSAELMRRGFPVVWQLEINDCSRAYGTERGDLRERLRRHGYRFYRYDVPRNRLAEEEPASGAMNTLAVRDASFVEERLSAS